MKSIEDIIIRMLVRKPFYAQIVSQFDRHETEEVTWAGVGYSGSNIILYYNPKKLLEEPQNIQEGVIEHEILHILSLHPFRREMREPYVFNVSSDLAINPMVGRQNLPKMTDKDEKEFGEAVGKKKGDSLVYFPDSFKPPLPEGKSAEEYYSLLMKDHVKFVGSGNCPDYQDKKSGDGSREGGSQGESKEDGKEKRGQSGKDSSQSTKRSCGGCAKNGNCERQKGGGISDFQGIGGSHKPWEEFGGTSESFGKVVVRDIVSKAINRCNRGRGDIPGNISEQVAALLESTVDWVSVMRFFGKAIRTSKKKSTWRKANWKFGNGTPGFKRKWKSKIVVAVDTSGSVSTRNLQKFAAEILMLQRTGNEITVIDFDTKVHREYKIRKKSDFDSRFVGRGGTRIQSVIDYIDEKKRQPSGLIVLTDMEGGPVTKPPYPVLFCITEDGSENNVAKDAPWCKTYLKMSDSDKKGRI